MINVGSFEFMNCNDGGFGYWGWIIVVNGLIISYFCCQKLFIVDGVNIVWIGIYVDVDEYLVDDGIYI